MKGRKRQAAPAAGSKEMPKRSMAHGKQRSKRKEGNPVKRSPDLMDAIPCWTPVHAAIGDCILTAKARPAKLPLPKKIR